MTAPHPLFDTWRADLAEEETIQVHPMFDDTPVLVWTPSDMAFIVDHDHDYDSYYEGPSSPRPEDPPQAQHEDTRQVDTPQPGDVPSTSNANEESQPSTRENQPRGYRNIFCPPQWAPVVPPQEAEDEASHHGGWSSSSS